MGSFGWISGDGVREGRRVELPGGGVVSSPLGVRIECSNGRWRVQNSLASQQETTMKKLEGNKPIPESEGELIHGNICYPDDGGAVTSSKIAQPPPHNQADTAPARKATEALRERLGMVEADFDRHVHFGRALAAMQLLVDIAVRDRMAWLCVSVPSTPRAILLAELLRGASWVVSVDHHPDMQCASLIAGLDSQSHGCAAGASLRVDKDWVVHPH